MKPTCYVMVGLPGTGKSTFVQDKLLPMLGKDAFVYSTDRFIENVAENTGKTYNDVFRDTIDEATKTMNGWLNMVVRDRNDVVWDQTNTGSKKRQRIVRRMENAGYRMEAICFIHPDPGMISRMREWRERLDAREGKKIPENVLENMMNGFSIPMLSEGFEKVTTYDIYGNILTEVSAPSSS